MFVDMLVTVQLSLWTPHHAGAVGLIENLDRKDSVTTRSADTSGSPNSTASYIVDVRHVKNIDIDRLGRHLIAPF